MLIYTMEQVKVERENQIIDYATQLQYSIDRAIIREIVLKGAKSFMRSLSNIPCHYHNEVAEVLKNVYKARGYQVEYDEYYCKLIIKLDEEIEDDDDEEEIEDDEDEEDEDEICDNCGCVINDEDEQVIVNGEIYCCQDCADEAQGIVGYCDTCGEAIFEDDHYSFDEEECVFTCEACLNECEDLD